MTESEKGYEQNEDDEKRDVKYNMKEMEAQANEHQKQNVKD